MLLLINRQKTAKHRFVSYMEGENLIFSSRNPFKIVFDSKSLCNEFRVDSLHFFGHHFETQQTSLCFEPASMTFRFACSFYPLLEYRRNFMYMYILLSDASVPVTASMDTLKDYIFIYLILCPRQFDLSRWSKPLSSLYRHYRINLTTTTLTREITNNVWLEISRRILSCHSW